MLDLVSSALLSRAHLGRLRCQPAGQACQHPSWTGCTSLWLCFSAWKPPEEQSPGSPSAQQQRAEEPNVMRTNS